MSAMGIIVELYAGPLDGAVVEIEATSPPRSLQFPSSDPMREYLRDMGLDVVDVECYALAERRLDGVYRYRYDGRADQT